MRLLQPSCVLLLLASGIAQAASEIYIKNETELALYISSISVSGAALNKKAWKAGADVIEPVSYTHLTLPTICSV